MALEPKTATCPCGEVIDVPTYDCPHNGEIYAVCNETEETECPKCHRHATGGNYKTGEVSGWITRREAEASQREYERQMFESDMNEWYGRGEW